MRLGVQDERRSAKLQSPAARKAGRPLQPRSPSGSLGKGRPSAASGLRMLSVEQDPPSSLTPAPPARGPAGFALQSTAPVDNGHSFVLGSGGPVSAAGLETVGMHEGTRGVAPPEMPEGSVHGVNPLQKWQVDTLREQKEISSIELGAAVQLKSAAVMESYTVMNRMIDDWEYTAEQSDLLRTSVQNAKVEFRSAQDFSNVHQKHIEDLRAESRELSLKEAELDLASSALPWVRHLPPDLGACKLCETHLAPVALCRVVRGHRNDLPDGDALEAVSFLHKNFTENAVIRGRYASFLAPDC